MSAAAAPRAIAADNTAPKAHAIGLVPKLIFFMPTPGGNEPCKSPRGKVLTRFARGVATNYRACGFRAPDLALNTHAGGIDAADQHRHLLSARRPVTSREQRREGCRTPGLGHDAQSRPQRLLRLTDGVIGDQHRLSDVGARDGEHQFADATWRRTVGGN